MAREVLSSPDKFIIKKLEQYPNVKLDMKYNHERFKEIESEFNLLDQDQSGWLSKAEISQHLQTKGCPIEMIQEIFNDLNTDSDERISKDEFSHGYLQKEKNISQEIQLNEIKLLEIRNQYTESKSLSNKQQQSQIILTIQSGCLQQLYQNLDQSEKAKISVELHMKCTNALEGSERFSKPSLNCEFPLWGDQFIYFFNQQQTKCEIEIMLIQISNNQQKAVAQSSVQYSFQNDFTKIDKIQFPQAGEIEISIQFYQDYIQQINKQILELEVQNELVMQEIIQKKKKLYFMQQLFGKETILNIKTQQQQFSKHQVMNIQPQIKQAQLEINQQQLMQSNQQQSQNNVSIYSEQYQLEQQQQQQQQEQLKPLPPYPQSIQYQQQQQIQQQEQLQINQDDIPFLDSFNLLKLNQFEKSTISVDLEQIYLQKRYKILLTLIGFILISLCFSKCDFLGLLILLFALPFKLHWNAQQIKLISIGICFSIVLDFIWLIVYYDCFRYNEQCHTEYGITDTIYLLSLIGIGLKGYIVYFIRNQ